MPVGGGSLGWKAINLFYIRNNVIDAYKFCQEHLPSSYCALHIRHTDLTSDYQRYIEENIRELSQFSVIFLATDNLMVIDDIRNLFPDLDFMTFSKSISTDGQPSHLRENRQQLDPYPINVDTLVDLLLLVNSTKIFSPVARNKSDKYAKTGKLSGFTRLAFSLQSDPHFMRSIDMSLDKIV